MQPNPQETADLVTFTEEILDGKLRFCAPKKVAKVKNCGYSWCSQTVNMQILVILECFVWDQAKRIVILILRR